MKLKYPVLAMICAANGVILFFVSFLAVGGHGEGRGVITVQVLGFAWIAMFTLVAVRTAQRGKCALATILAAMTLPAAWVAGMVVLIGSLLRSLLGF
ncbi:hypothetical protein [Chitiniphilus eburneus]|uniref:Uncharacterized protein n=1 Tax=Chitiniphilus eburneus TaxID=2571148 RepID=A0A4V5MP82_9NEIS|nr:hypothetical protein [Chitiniphilus eburneus]TJZ67448.1 hypothetical protein FAZ21_16390 [Chitiniphilus eburneus]